MPSTLHSTGGTTGRSKGVDLRHRAVATNVSQRESLVRTEAGNERILVITPLLAVEVGRCGLALAYAGRLCQQRLQQRRQSRP